MDAGQESRRAQRACGNEQREGRPRRMTQPMPERATAPDEVLRDIRHELGNHFHKLYFWAEAVQDSEPVSAQDTTEQPLQRTIQNLERFLELAMTYLEPLRIEPVTMSTGDVARAALQVLQTEFVEGGVQLDLAADVESRELSLDPGRFSAVLRKVAQALRAAGVGDRPQCQLHVRAADDSSRIEFLVAAPIAPAATPMGEMHVLEWANAQHTMESHGGRLSPCNAVDGTAEIRLVLPWIG